MENSYNSLWYAFAKKWRFNDGLHGVIGSYMFCKSFDTYILKLWVSDKRCFDGRKTREIYKTTDADEMHKYLEANKPE